MKIRLLTLVFLSLLPSLLFSQTFTILHTNDMHSRLMGFAPSSDYSPDVTGNDSTLGGFARIAGYFDQVENELGEKPLILDGGDFLMGTLFHTLEITEGFQLRLMKKMGYDVVTLGNHEFDFGVEDLGKIIVNATKKGSIPPLVLSNIQFNPDEPEDNLLQELYQNKTIQSSYIMEYMGIKIGFFGLVGVEAANVAPFVRPAAFTDRLVVAKELSTYLKETEKVDLVICLSHCGLKKDKKGKWTGEDVELAKEVDDIDLIISGHSHTHLFEPLIINNTPIVQAGSEGQFVGRIDLDWTNGNLTVLDAGLNIINDDIPGKPDIQQEILSYQTKIIEEIFANLNLKPGKALVETSFDLTFSEQGNMAESNLAPLVVDAIHWYINQTIHNDITMVAAGLIRDNIRKGSSGQQLPNDIFRILPLGSGVFDDSPGYSLAQIFLTGKEVKNVLEAMLIAPKMNSANLPFWSGIRYKYNPRRIVLDQVYEVSLGSEESGYEKIDLSKNNEKLYSLTTNNYVLEFFGLVTDITFGLLKIEPKNEFGQPIEDLNSLLIDGSPGQPGLQEMKEWAALMGYMSEFPDTNGNGIPDIPDFYQGPHQAGERIPSLNPVQLWANGNGIMTGVSLIALVLLSGTGLIFIL
ncbi:MAG: 5'-nucleotidase C-terminal domain-containing protein [Bacteroidota bacterium]|nr:5'-nucleotidase C-terminal domain-containing protein [Bacteroidota bacterium]